jgi:hypothetical protein
MPKATMPKATMPKATIQRPSGTRLLDIAIVLAGALALGFSFLSYYTVSVVYLSESATAWHGFFGWFGAVLAASGAAVLVAAVLAPQRTLPVPPGPAALVLFCLGAGSTFGALFTNGYGTSPHVAGAEVETGHGYGYWLSLAVIVAGAALAALRVRRAGRSADSLRGADGTLGCESTDAEKPGEGETT